MMLNVETHEWSDNEMSLKVVVIEHTNLYIQFHCMFVDTYKLKKMLFLSECNNSNLLSLQLTSLDSILLKSSRKDLFRLKDLLLKTLHFFFVMISSKEMLFLLLWYKSNSCLVVGPGKNPLEYCSKYQRCHFEKYSRL